MPAPTAEARPEPVLEVRTLEIQDIVFVLLRMDGVALRRVGEVAAAPKVGSHRGSKASIFAEGLIPSDF